MVGSMWAATLPEAMRVTGEPLAGDADVDVAVVGAGYTGLWTAYYLVRADPHLRVAVLEREVVGFGASGRNGGWCSALLAAGIGTIARRSGREAAIAMQQAMYATVDEVGRVVADEGIDAAVHQGRDDHPRPHRGPGVPAAGRARGSALVRVRRRAPPPALGRRGRGPVPRAPTPAWPSTRPTARPSIRCASPTGSPPRRNAAGRGSTSTRRSRPSSRVGSRPRGEPSVPT